MPLPDRLIVLGSTITALSLARNARRLGIECLLVDTSHGPAMRTRCADKLIVADAQRSGEFLELLVEAKHEGSAALIADSDTWLRWLVRHRETLESAFTVLHPPNETIDICLNKSKFLSWCKESGLPAPALYSPASLDTIDFSRAPVLVRPEQTLHGQRTRLPKAIEVRSRASLDELLVSYRESGATACISESLIRPGVRQFSVGLARNRRGEHEVFVAEKVRPDAERCAGGTYVIPSPNRRIAKLATYAADKLDYFGIMEAEIFLDEERNQPYFVEINARPWVQYELARVCGFDFLSFLLGGDHSRAGTKKNQNHAWLSLWDDLYVCFSRSGMVRGGQLSIARYIASLIKADTYAFWSWSDPLPAVGVTIERAKAFSRAFWGRLRGRGRRP